MSDLLFLAHRVPFPPNRGDKIRSYHVFRHLSARARVHLVAFADDPVDLDPPAAFTDGLSSCHIVPRAKSRPRAVVEALATGKPASLTAFANPALARAVSETLADNAIGAIYAFSGQMAQYLPAADGRRVVMDFGDVDSAKFGGLAAQRRGPISALLRREARLLGAYERAVAATVDATLFVSAAEAAMFRTGGARGNVLVSENGVDARYFDPAAEFDRIDRPGPLIVFTGQMDYLPNIEAAMWFTDAVLPGIHLRRPDARFAIVGRAPTAAVQALGRRPGVVVTGEVADVRGWLAVADACVAPLRLARGIQNKVLEAMAMARPVVATPAAAEGIDHAGTIRVADDPHAFGDAVSALIDDRDVGGRLGAAARAQVLARYDWEARLASLGPLLGLEA